MDQSDRWLASQHHPFAILVNGLAWLGPVPGGDPTAPGLGFLIWAVAPIVSALVAKFLLRDKVSLCFSPAFKGDGRWYVLSILAYPVALSVVVFLGLLLDASTISNLTLCAFAAGAIPLAVTYLILAVLEVGWRGYLAPKVASVDDGLLGHVLVGLIWASWHLPYLRELWAHTSEGWVTLVPRLILGTIVFAIVYGEIRIRTGSVWPAVLMDWIGNTFANTLLIGYTDKGNGAAVYEVKVPGALDESRTDWKGKTTVPVRARVRGRRLGLWLVRSTRLHCTACCAGSTLWDCR